MAYHTLKEMGCIIRQSDQSYIFNGEVSITHIGRALNVTCSPSVPPPHIFHCLVNNGILKLADIGDWTRGYSQPQFYLKPGPLPQSPVARHALQVFLDWWMNLSLSEVADFIVGTQPALNHIMISSRLPLLIPPTTLQTIAEDTILASAAHSHHAPVPQGDDTTHILLAATV